MRALLLALLPLAGWAAAARAEVGAPLSAIDWLSQSVASAPPAAPPPPAEPPVADDASAPAITVTPLDGGDRRATGLLPPSVTGLPLSLWSRSSEGTLIPLIAAEGAVSLPALQQLLATLLLAEAEPPFDAASFEPLFLARVDKLLDMGALDAARALLEDGDLTRPEPFRRYFDVTLLTGTEAQACAMLRDRPALAPTLPARVFCLARNGDWPAAALTLGTARALGDVSPEEDELLSAFLDPELVSESPAPPGRPTPLDYRLREATGEVLPTATLPLAFAQADLRSTVAWRAQIEAAERLARAGAVSENVLLGHYTARRPAAAGGVWDRADAMQRLDAALSSGEGAAEALPAAWAAMREVGTEVPFARLFGARLAALGLGGEAGPIALRAGLLSPAYEAVARAATPATAREALWVAIARGDVAGLQPDDAREAAVVAAFAGAPIPEPLAAQVAEGRLGEALLRALAAFAQGLDGDHGALTDALATLRGLGLEDVARQAALQALILGEPA